MYETAQITKQRPEARVATAERSLGSIIGNISYQAVRPAGAVYAPAAEQCSRSFDEPLIRNNDPRTNILLH